MRAFAFGARSRSRRPIPCGSPVTWNRSLYSWANLRTRVKAARRSHTGSNDSGNDCFSLPAFEALPFADVRRYCRGTMLPSFCRAK